MTTVEPGIRVRPAGPGDEPRVAAMARALSADSIRRRFMAAIARDRAADELEREAHGGPDQLAYVAEDASGAVVGEAYAARCGKESFETAFVVADRSQHHGIGTLLFATVARELARRGVRRMRIETLATNADMLAIVAASALPCTQERSDGTVVATLTLS